MRSAIGWSVAVVVVAACGGGGSASSSGESSRVSASGRDSTAEAGRERVSSPTGGRAGGPTRRGGARHTVLMVGTSLTAGLGLDPEDAYPSLLQQKADSAGLSVEVVNAGLSGETSAGALRRIDWLLRGPADVVVIETGANDGLRGLDVDSSRANLRGIVEKVKAARPGARILLAQMEAPPNLGAKYTAAFHAMYQDVARETGASVMPFLLEGVAGVRSLNQGDGIHPNERGERIVADNVWRSLEPVLRQLDGAAAGG